jgi:hypothetical protein
VYKHERSVTISYHALRHEEKETRGNVISSLDKKKIPDNSKIYSSTGQVLGLFFN